MKNQEIQLHEADLIRTGVRVDYSIVDDAGIANVKTVISTEALTTYIVEENMNAVCIDVIEGGYDFLDAKEYLADNIFEVVSLYLQSNLAA